MTIVVLERGALIPERGALRTKDHRSLEEELRGSSGMGRTGVLFCLTQCQGSWLYMQLCTGSPVLHVQNEDAELVPTEPYPTPAPTRGLRK